jgi:hypothetical protein
LKKAPVQGAFFASARRPGITLRKPLGEALQRQGDGGGLVAQAEFRPRLLALFHLGEERAIQFQGDFAALGHAALGEHLEALAAIDRNLHPRRDGVAERQIDEQHALLRRQAEHRALENRHRLAVLAGELFDLHQAAGGFLPALRRGAVGDPVAELVAVLHRRGGRIRRNRADRDRRDHNPRGKGTKLTNNGHFRCPVREPVQDGTPARTAGTAPPGPRRRGGW